MRFTIFLISHLAFVFNKKSNWLQRNCIKLKKEFYNVLSFRFSHELCRFLPISIDYLSFTRLN